MIALKRIDIYGQMILITGFFVNGFLGKQSDFLYGYFAVGIWQIISVILHFLFRNKIVTAIERKYYHLFLLSFAGVASLIFSFYFPEVVFYFLMTSIFLTPLAAVCYCLLSLRELKIWQHRQFIQLR